MGLLEDEAVMWVPTTLSRRVSCLLGSEELSLEIRPCAISAEECSGRTEDGGRGSSCWGMRGRGARGEGMRRGWGYVRRRAWQGVAGDWTVDEPCEWEWPGKPARYTRR